MKFEITTKKINTIKADCEFVLIIEKNLDHKWITNKAEFKELGFESKAEEVCFLPHAKKVYGVVKDLDRDEIRIIISSMLKAIKKTTYKTIKIGSYVKNCPVTNIKAIVEGAILGSYSFDKYKSKKESSIKREFIISLDEYEDKEIKLEDAKKALHSAMVIANATNFTKDIVNTPPDDMTPKKLAKVAKNLAKEYDEIECFVGDEKFLKKEKMGAFLAVARASEHEARFIHLSYKPKDAKDRFVFVGKGLTYDSGGLSLKPSDYMVSMKSDKSGACAALGIIKGAVELNLKSEIHVIIGACENMIGGNSYKPDDILKAKDGTTIEVQNTDAEGRLVLADCLCYAIELKPDYLVDLATLTGACVVALGEYSIGVMGHNKELIDSLMNSSSRSGELCAHLPFNRHLKKLLKSDVADICNISSSRYGGAITAALFLDKFIKDEYKDRWLHIDIAGPAFVNKEWGYNQAGASGAGVRMALYWLKDHEYKKERN